MATIDDELSKGEVVCGNCHLDRTYRLQHHLLPGEDQRDGADFSQADLFIDKEVA